MARIASECCEFYVDTMPARRGYCYSCRTVHRHKHLDLTALRQTLLVRVGAKHVINWPELMKDDEKIEAAQEKSFCQTLLTELDALCPHQKPLYYEEAPLRLMTCYKQGGQCFLTGLDFTTDLCSRPVSKGGEIPPDELGFVATAAAELAKEFNEGDILRYDPKNCEFAHLRPPAKPSKSGSRNRGASR